MKDVPGLMPVVWGYYDKWAIRSVSIERQETPEIYLSPHRRDFYKVMLIVKADGFYTIGMKTFYINEPTILFIPPDEIICWKGVSGHSISHYCLFKKHFSEGHPVLKAAMAKYRLFTDSDKNVIRLQEKDLAVLTPLFLRMQEVEKAGGSLAGYTSPH